MIYIAAPFFKPHEVQFVQEIEDRLIAEEIEFFSPRTSGTLIEMSNEKKQQVKNEMFKINVSKIFNSSGVVAVIDDRDVGTIWEMGFAHACQKPTISISNQDYGLNVMLAESVQAHVRTLDDMVKAIRDRTFTGEIIRDVY